MKLLKSVEKHIDMIERFSNDREIKKIFGEARKRLPIKALSSKIIDVSTPAGKQTGNASYKVQSTSYKVQDAKM